ncbi:MAG: hypothetical protein KAS12_06490 [Candidatus Aenigmarchaeota archaeon]|nr:hypothetical protein [Candidatus Aenigmarchaeota archaeon]
MDCLKSVLRDKEIADKFTRGICKHKGELLKKNGITLPTTQFRECNAQDIRECIFSEGDSAYIKMYCDNNTNITSKDIHTLFLGHMVALGVQSNIIVGDNKHVVSMLDNYITLTEKYLESAKLAKKMFQGIITQTTAPLQNFTMLKNLAIPRASMMPGSAAITKEEEEDNIIKQDIAAFLHASIQN